MLVRYPAPRTALFDGTTKSGAADAKDGEGKNTALLELFVVAWLPRPSRGGGLDDQGMPSSSGPAGPAPGGPGRAAPASTPRRWAPATSPPNSGTGAPAGSSPRATQRTTVDDNICLKVLVVGFDHAIGNRVELVVPPFDDGKLPPAWQYLHFLAMPDGVHENERDTVFFTLPRPDRGTADDSAARIHATSCYCSVSTTAAMQQLGGGGAAGKKGGEGAITRSAVQKAVVVLCRLPLYGLVAARLRPAADAYARALSTGTAVPEEVVALFERLNCPRTGLLAEARSLREIETPRRGAGLWVAPRQHPALFAGVSVTRLFAKFRAQTLLLLKAVLLQRRVAFHGVPAYAPSQAVLAVAACLPGQLSALGGQELGGLRKWGLPLKLRPVQPHAALQGLQQELGGGGALVGCSPNVAALLRQRSRAAKAWDAPGIVDVLADATAGTVEMISPAAGYAVALTASESAFVERLLVAVDAVAEELDATSAAAGASTWPDAQSGHEQMSALEETMVFEPVRLSSPTAAAAAAGAAFGSGGSPRGAAAERRSSSGGESLEQIEAWLRRELQGYVFALCATDAAARATEGKARSPELVAEARFEVNVQLNCWGEPFVSAWRQTPSYEHWRAAWMLANPGLTVPGDAGRLPSAASVRAQEMQSAGLADDASKAVVGTFSAVMSAPAVFADVVNRARAGEMLPAAAASAVAEPPAAAAAGPDLEAQLTAGQVRGQSHIAGATALAASRTQRRRERAASRSWSEWAFGDTAESILEAALEEAAATDASTEQMIGYVDVNAQGKCLVAGCEAAAAHVVPHHRFCAKHAEAAAAATPAGAGAGAGAAAAAAAAAAAGAGAAAVQTPPPVRDAPEEATEAAAVAAAAVAAVATEEAESLTFEPVGITSPPSNRARGRLPSADLSAVPPQTPTTAASAATATVAAAAVAAGSSAAPSPAPAPAAVAAEPVYPEREVDFVEGLAEGLLEVILPVKFLRQFCC